MEKKEFLYEGKAKQIFATDDPNLIIVRYKDDATAFNGEKKSSINNKGVLNNKITEIFFNKMTEAGIPNHFVKRLDDREQLCKKVTIVPLEFVVRNLVAGSMSKRLAIEEGYQPSNVIYDICYKKDELGDPLINDHHAVALGAATYEELALMYDLTRRINELLKTIADGMGVILVDFKIEFGKDAQGNIILADEISPDTARFWDKITMKKLDKDRFRRDLGDVEEAYMEILERLKKTI